MIVTEIYKGQGVGNQLATYITTRLIAIENGYDFGIKSPENFKAHSLFNLDFGKKIIGGRGPEGGPPFTLPLGILHYYNERKIIHPNGSDISLYDPYLFKIPDNTKIDGNMQGEKYMEKYRSQIKEWLKIKESADCLDYADENTCVINFRGGEYVNHKYLFLRKEYWEYAIKEMKNINPNFRFVVITDDENTAKKFFPELDVHHFSIEKDYAIIKNAKYLILSNSSFPWFPAWLSDSLKLCIGPKYWGRHNISDGYWSLGTNITKKFHYIDREGKIFTGEECLREHDEYVRTHKSLYPTVNPPDYKFIPQTLFEAVMDKIEKKFDAGMNRLKNIFDEIK